MLLPMATEEPAVGDCKTPEKAGWTSSARGGIGPAETKLAAKAATVVVKRLKCMVNDFFKAEG